MNAADERLRDLYGMAAAKSEQRRRLDVIYARHGIAPAEGPERLVEEIRRDGSHTLVSLFRGREGVHYDEIVRDVSEKLNVLPANGEDERALDARCLYALIQKSARAISEKDGESTKSWRPSERALLESLVGDAVDEQEAKRILTQAGPKVVAGIVANIAAVTAIRAGVVRAAGLAGFAIPFINIALGVWTIADLMGPAYRKTVPTVLENALLRLELGGARH
jgi:uncharacterized protein YaaW (UPF0174 family)